MTIMHGNGPKSQNSRDPSGGLLDQLAVRRYATFQEQVAAAQANTQGRLSGCTVAGGNPILTADAPRTPHIPRVPDSDSNQPIQGEAPTPPFLRLPLHPPCPLSPLPVSDFEPSPSGERRCSTEDGVGRDQDPGWPPELSIPWQPTCAEWSILAASHPADAMPRWEGHEETHSSGYGTPDADGPATPRGHGQPSSGDNEQTQTQVTQAWLDDLSDSQELSRPQGRSPRGTQGTAPSADGPSPYTVQL